MKKYLIIFLLIGLNVSAMINYVVPITYNTTICANSINSCGYTLPNDLYNITFFDLRYASALNNNYFIRIPELSTNYTLDGGNLHINGTLYSQNATFEKENYKLFINKALTGSIPNYVANFSDGTNYVIIANTEYGIRSIKPLIGGYASAFFMDNIGANVTITNGSYAMSINRGTSGTALVVNDISGNYKSSFSNGVCAANLSNANNHVILSNANYGVWSVEYSGGMAAGNFTDGSNHVVLADGVNGIKMDGSRIVMKTGAGTSGGSIYMDGGIIYMPSGSYISDGTYKSFDAYNRKFYKTDGSVLLDYSGSTVDIPLSGGLRLKDAVTGVYCALTSTSGVVTCV